MKTSIRRFLAVTTTAAVAMTGALSLGAADAAPAAAKSKITNYAFNGWAYGSYVNVGPVGVTSSPTAYAYLGCTRRTAIARKAALVAADVPKSGPALQVGAIKSTSNTYRKAGGRVGVLSTNKIAKVRLGAAGAGLPSLVLKGLSTRSDAYATKRGKLRAKSNFTLVDIKAEGTPLDDILNGALNPLNALIKQILKAPGDQLLIPGLGRIALGRNYNKVYSNHAVSNATSLRIHLFGLDGKEGGADDVRTIVGRSFSRIAKKVPNGVMGGSAQAIQGSLLADMVGVGPVTDLPLRCEGTNGKIRKQSTVGLDLLNQDLAVAGVAQSRVYGKQYKNGSIRAWTEGSIANVTIGGAKNGLQIKGIVAKANIKRTKRGKIYKNINGSRILSLSLAGQELKLPKPGKTIEVPGVAKVQFYVRSASKRRIKVTAVRVTLLDGTLATLNLGVAKASVRKS